MKHRKPTHGEIFWFESSVPGHATYRVFVVYLQVGPAGPGFYNVAGVPEPLDPDYIASKVLHLLVNSSGDVF